MSENNYTYMLRCGDGSLYTGWTNHIRKRLTDHQSGRGAKYTRSHQPVELVYLEVYDTREEAMHREAVIKKLSRVKKLALIAEHPGWRTLMPPAETEQNGDGV